MAPFRFVPGTSGNQPVEAKMPENGVVKQPFMQGNDGMGGVGKSWNLFKMDKQGKWQAIMQLEMQDPKHMLTFSSKDILWSEIARSNGYFDRVAKILSHRVSNFIRGEEMNPDAPCSFIRRKKKESGQNDTASLSYEVYACCYGPEDKREQPKFALNEKSKLTPFKVFKS